MHRAIIVAFLSIAQLWRIGFAAVTKCEDFEVTITVDYIPPSTFADGPPNYRAASAVNLTCNAKGSSDYTKFKWISTCDGPQPCFVKGQKTRSVQTADLHSYDSGVHTCVVYDAVGCSRMADVTMNVVGAGIIINGTDEVLPNNSIIVIGSSREMDHFNCVSGSRESGVGQFISPVGHDVVQPESNYSVYAVQGNEHNPGLIHILSRFSLPASEQGVYTCRIPDEDGNIVDVNVGLYLSRFATAPVISQLEQNVAGSLLTLTCTSHGSSPTNVMWVKDGQILDTRNYSNYVTTQLLLERATSTYASILTIKGSYEDAIGKYLCMVTNSIGTSSGPTKSIKGLQVKGHDTPLIVGVAGELTCTAEFTVSSVEWFLVTDTGNISKEIVYDSQSLSLPLSLNSSTQDGNEYICRVVSPSGKEYEERVSIQVLSRNVTVQIIYTPPDLYPDYEPPNYRAASSVKLQCIAEGTVGEVQYQWSSTCNNCFAADSQSSTISENILRSHDAGIHTCSVTDEGGHVGNASIHMNIIGAGIYVTHSQGYSGSQAAQPNNSYIIADTGVSMSPTRVALHCCSNSTSSNIGSITFPSGVTVHSTSIDHDSLVSVHQHSDEYTGCVSITITAATYISYLLHNDAGLFTCNIPDSSGTVNHVSFGIYNEGFNTLPHIRRLSHVSMNTSLMLSCESGGSPPASITWLRDGTIINGAENTTELIQVMDRQLNQYKVDLIINDFSYNYVDSNYSCVIGNGFGQESRKLDIRGVQTTTNVTTLTVGESVLFTCTSDLEIQESAWIKGGHILSESKGTSSQFVLNPLSTNDQDTQYTCRVVTSYGTLEEILVLNVEVPSIWATVVVSDSGNGEAYALNGENNSLECTVKTIAGMDILPSVSWMLSNNSEVLGDGRITVSGVEIVEGSSSLLNFMPVQPSDQQSYTCVASVSVPWLMSQPPQLNKSVDFVVTTLQVKVSVDYIPPEPGYVPPNYRAASSVTLRCSLISSTSSSYTRYQWFSTSSSSYLSQRYGASITINPLTSNDAGVHTCVAVTGNGRVGSDSIRMNVVGAGIYVSTSGRKGRPQYSQPNNTYITLSSTYYSTRVSLQCCSNFSGGNGSFTFPDGVTTSTIYSFASIQRLSTGCSQLIIYSTTRSFSLGSNAGIYTCNFLNSNGEMTHVHFGLYNQHTNAFPVVHSLHSVTSDTNLTLVCVTHNGPVTNVTWVKDDNLLTIDGHATQMTHRIIDRQLSAYETSLIIHDDPRNFIGKYECLAGSTLGTVKGETSVLFNRITKSSSLVHLGDDVTITCGSDLTLTRAELFYNGQLISATNGTSTEVTLTDLSTHHEGNYTCRVSTPIGVEDRNTTLDIQVPNQWATIHINNSNGQRYYTLSGESYTLTCRVQAVNGLFIPPLVEWVDFNGTVLRSEENIAITNSQASDLLTISSLTINSTSPEEMGRYSCRANVHIPWMVSQLPPHTASADLVVISSVRRVAIQVLYTPPDQYPDYSPPNYRAASSVTLQCIAEGTAVEIQYQWSSTCSGCFASSSRVALIRENFLRSRDAGVHTCTVMDSLGLVGSASIPMNIVGAGIYVTQSEGYGGEQAAQPNNTYITIDNSYRSSHSVRARLYCCSNSSSSRVGSYTLPSGITTTTSSSLRNYDITRQSGSYAGCISFSVSYRYYGTYLLTGTNSGVYTCNIPDASGRMHHVSFGLFNERFQVAPQWSNISSTVSGASLTLSCETTAAPPTNVTWLKDGDILDINGDTTKITYGVVSRPTSVYQTNITITATNSSLLLDNFTCVVANRFGSVGYLSHQHIIPEATKISYEILTVGQQGELQCAGGIPFIKAQWLQDGNSTLESSDGGAATLVLDPVSTDDQGVQYTCKITTDDLQEYAKNFTVNVEVPDEWATVEVENSRAYVQSGNNHSLSCIARNIAGMSAIPLVEWLGPNSRVIKSGGNISISSSHNTTTNTVESTLSFNPIQTSDRGLYSCRARANISGLRVQPPMRTSSNVDLRVGEEARKVTIAITYTPPDENYAPPNYRAASSVTLRCVGETPFGRTYYRWSSTCDNRCFASGSTSSTISENFLRSRDAGIHTCTVTDDLGIIGSVSVPMNIVGAGIYVSQSGGHGGEEAAQPNNTYVTVENHYLSYFRNRARATLYCCSNSSQSSIGSYTLANGRTISSRWSDFTVTRQSGTYTGCILFSVYYQSSGSYHLTGTNSGVYTCNIPDDSGHMHHVSFGLFNSGYRSRPQITKTDKRVSSDGLLLQCDSDTAPPTFVQWLKNNKNLTDDGQFIMSAQEVLTRSTSVYSNTLKVAPSNIDDVFGNYSCVIKNKHGFDRVDLTIGSIGVDIPSDKLVVGQVGTVLCKSDILFARKEWIREGNIIAESDNGMAAVLKLTPVSTDDQETEYTCRVNSSYGVEEINTTLITEVERSWVQNMDVSSSSSQGSYVFNNTNVTLTCSLRVVDGMYILPELEWLYSTGELVQSTGDIVVGDQNTEGLVSSVTLRFDPIVTTDRGQYTCRGSVHVPWMIIQPPSRTGTINVIVTALKVHIEISYDPPDSNSDYEPPNYRVASSVTLRCVVEGAVGSVRYVWSSTCSHCFASTSSNETIRQGILSTRDTGVHTCSVTDSAGHIGIGSTQMNVVGAGIYVTNSAGHGGQNSVLPNNSYVTVHTGYHYGTDRVSLYCCSNTQPTYPSSFFTFPDGSISPRPYYATNTHYSVNLHYGNECMRLYISVGRYFNLEIGTHLGVYTCNIRDASGAIHNVNFGLYGEFASTAPSVANLYYENSDTQLTLRCISDRVPPTKVVWMKDGAAISENVTNISQTILSRNDSTYETSISIGGHPFDHQGTYSCIVANNHGNDSTELELRSLRITQSSIVANNHRNNSTELELRNLQITQSTSPLIVGETVVFTCSGDFNVTSAQWWRGDSIISESGALAQFTLNPVSTDDEGVKYTCKLNTSYGVLEKNITLHVEVPSDWAQVRAYRASDQNALHGTDYSLVCVVDTINGMNIPLSIEWLNSNDTVVESMENVVVDDPLILGNQTTVILRFNPVLTNNGGVYTCRAMINVPWMSVQPPQYQDRVNMIVTTQEMFQLWIEGPLHYCADLDTDKAQSLEMTIKHTVEKGVRNKCKCDFQYSAIYSGGFSCKSSATSVTYRAIINGTSDFRTATQLLNYVDEWRNTDGTMMFTLFRLSIAKNTECPLKIQSFTDPECAV